MALLISDISLQACYHKTFSCEQPLCNPNMKVFSLESFAMCSIDSIHHFNECSIREYQYNFSPIIMSAYYTYYYAGIIDTGLLESLD